MKTEITEKEKELISWTTNTYETIDMPFSASDGRTALLRHKKIDLDTSQFDNYERITDEEIKLVKEKIARGDYDGK